MAGQPPRDDIRDDSTSDYATNDAAGGADHPPIHPGVSMVLQAQYAALGLGEGRDLAEDLDEEDLAELRGLGAEVGEHTRAKRMLHVCVLYARGYAIRIHNACENPSSTLWPRGGRRRIASPASPASHRQPRIASPASPAPHR